jgi:hypothetical protein
MMQRYDVVAVNIKTLEERVLTRDKGEADAEAFLRIAVARRGVTEELYKLVPAKTQYSAHNTGSAQTVETAHDT